MRKSLILAAALFGLAAAPAWANSCPRHMADIDAALAKSPPCRRKPWKRSRDCGPRANACTLPANTPNPSKP